NQMADQGAGTRIAVDAAHQGAVYLDGIDGEAAQIVEGGGAGAEIVDTDLDPRAAQGAETAVGGGDVGQGCGLGHFDDEAAAVVRLGGRHLQQGFDIGVIGQRCAGDIDGDLEQTGTRLAQAVDDLFGDGEVEVL